MDKKTCSNKKNEGYTIIPEREIKCVWMTAGLISFKLCKYNLQCDRCPLDRELRNIPPEDIEESVRFDPGTPLNGEGSEVQSSKEELINVKRSLFYHAGHTWIKFEKYDEVRVGIDHFLAKLLRGVQVIILPMPKRHGVYELICKDPLKDGFLLTMRPKDFQQDQKHLFYGEYAFDWCKKEWERFKETAISKIPSDPNKRKVGITMQDGEITIKEIKNLIEPIKYTQLLDNFLREGEKIYSRLKNKINIES